MDENIRNQGTTEDTHVRDKLALIRTVLANERTFLAYLRSSMTLIVTGVTAVHFISGQTATWTGAVLVLLGLACLAFGAIRFRMARHAISESGHSNAGYKS